MIVSFPLDHQHLQVKLERLARHERVVAVQRHAEVPAVRRLIVIFTNRRRNLRYVDVKVGPFGHGSAESTEVRFEQRLQ